MWIAVDEARSFGIGPFPTEEAAQRYVDQQESGWKVVFVSWPGRWRN